MLLKMHKTPMGEVAALCDSELIGKTLSQGGVTLDLGRHACFYSGKRVKEEEAIAALRRADNVNLVGVRSLLAAKKAGIATSGAIMICDVPHLQIYRLP